MSDPWTWVGDRALLRRFDGPLEEANAAARALYARLALETPDEIEDLIPGARTLFVLLHHGREPGDELADALARPPTASAEQLVRPPTASAEQLVPQTLDVPVVYGGAAGPDLADVAAMHDMTEDEVVAAHSAAEYTVAFIGFSPGFAYLLGLPERLATPRLETPRRRVDAGSVGIGGEYTGVYPSATAGGWRIIGRTNVRFWDIARERPALLLPGDRVRFVRA